MNKPTALIIGVSGQVGSYLAELLLNKNYNVVGIKRRTSLIATDRINHLFSNPNFKVEYGNINDSHSIYKIIEHYRPSEIYNQAAMSHVRVSFDCSEEAIQTTVLGTLNVLNNIKEINPNIKLYNAGSSEQWGNNLDVPHDENSKMMPCSPYAIGKVAAYHLVKNYRESYNMFCCSGITNNMESSRRGETFATRKITMGAAKIKLGLQDKLFMGNLDAKRDWQYCGDAVEAMWLMLQQEQPDDFVIASGKTYSIKDFLNLVFDFAGLNPDKYVEIDPRLFRPQEVPILLGNPAKAKKVLGWETKMSLEDLAKKMYLDDLELLDK